MMKSLLFLSFLPWILAADTNDFHFGDSCAKPNMTPDANCKLDLTFAVDFSTAMKSKDNVYSLANYTLSSLAPRFKISEHDVNVAFQSMGTWQSFNTLYFNKYKDFCDIVDRAVKNVKYFGHRISKLNEVFSTYLMMNNPFLNRPNVQNVLVILTAINDAFNIDSAIPLSLVVRKHTKVVLIGINQIKHERLERIADQVIFVDFNKYGQIESDFIVENTCGKPIIPSTVRPTTTTTIPSTTTTTIQLTTTKVPQTTAKPTVKQSSAAPSSEQPSDAPTTEPNTVLSSENPSTFVPVTEVPSNEPSTSAKPTENSSSSLAPVTKILVSSTEATDEPSSAVPSERPLTAEPSTVPSSESSSLAPVTENPEPSSEATIVPQSSKAPSTAVPSEQPSSEAPSDEPSTLAPATENPDPSSETTNVPHSSEVPLTILPNTEQPSSLIPQSSSEAPSDEPLTDAPITDQPSSEIPSEQPSTLAPATENPKPTSEATVEPSEIPSSDIPITDHPVSFSTIEPVSGNPSDLPSNEPSTIVSEEPATEVPSELPASELPSEQPSSLLPITENPEPKNVSQSSEAPSTVAPNTEQPSSEAPSDEPLTDAPITKLPTSQSPFEQPSSLSPVTENPEPSSKATNVPQSSDAPSTATPSEQPSSGASESSFTRQSASEIPSTDVSVTQQTDLPSVEPSSEAPSIEPSTAEPPVSSNPSEQPSSLAPITGNPEPNSEATNVPSTPESVESTTEGSGLSSETPVNPTILPSKQSTTEISLTETPEKLSSIVSTTDVPNPPTTEQPALILPSDEPTNEIPTLVPSSEAPSSTQPSVKPSEGISTELTPSESPVSSTPESEVTTKLPQESSKIPSSVAPEVNTEPIQESTIAVSESTSTIPPTIRSTTSPLRNNVTNPLSNALGSPCSNDVSHAWLDVVFLIDTSSPIKKVELNRLGGTIAGFFSKFTIDKKEQQSTRVGIVTYAKTAKKRANLNQFASWDELYKEFTKLGNFHSKDSEIDIPSALKEGQKLLEKQKSERIPTIVVVVSSSNSEFVNEEAIKVANKVKASGIKIVTLTFKTTSNVSAEPLSQLASKPNYGLVSNDPNLYDKLTDSMAEINCVCPLLTYQFSNKNQIYGDCIQGFHGQTPANVAKLMCELSDGILVPITTQQKLDFLAENVVPIELGDVSAFTIGLHHLSEKISDEWIWEYFNGTEIPLGEFKNWKNTPELLGDYCASSIKDSEGNWKFAPTSCDHSEAKPYICQTKACDSSRICDLEVGIRAAQKHAKLQSMYKTGRVYNIDVKKL